MKWLLCTLALFVAMPLAAQTPIKYQVRMQRPIDISFPYTDTSVSGFRLKLTQQGQTVAKQWGTDYPASQQVNGIVLIHTAYPATGTFDLQACAFGTVFNDLTAVEEVRELCSDPGQVQLVFNKNGFDKPTTVTVTVPPLGTVSTTSGVGGTTTTTTPK